jgi:hypothetical protein
MTRYFIQDLNGKTLHVPTLSHGAYGGEESISFAKLVAASIPFAKVVSVKVAA